MGGLIPIAIMSAIQAIQDHLSEKKENKKEQQDTAKEIAREKAQQGVLNKETYGDN